MLYQMQNPHGGDLYGRPVQVDFSANTNPLGTPPAVRRAVQDSLDRLHQYPDPYCRVLVRAIADFEGLPESDILCGCGAAELIFSYCAAVRPLRALELAPTFSEYASALESVGCAVERWPLRRENRFALDASFLDCLKQGNWDAVFLCNPNNPTGQLIDLELLMQIAGACHDRGIRLFVDECFLDLTDAGRTQSLKEHLARWPELFLLKAFTKSYGMAGLRLGYCLSADRALLTAMGRCAQPWNVSVPAQAAGVAALGETAFLEETRRLIRAQRPWLQEQLTALGLTVYPSCANYLLFYSPLPLSEKLLEQGIQLRSCANYHGLGEGWYRIAVKRPEENRLLIAALKKIMEGC